MMGPVDCGGWGHPLHAPAAGACAGGTWQLGGDGGRWRSGRAVFSRRPQQRLPLCQRRTCGINLEPMHAMQSPGEAITEWEASSETGRIPGAKSVWHAQQGARKAGARSWRHI